MISRIPLSCLRQSLFKQSVRSVNATIAASARGRGSNLSQEWLNEIFLRVEPRSDVGKTEIEIYSILYTWSFEPTQEEIENRRESRKAAKEDDGQSANTSSSEKSPKWDSSPQNIWISNSLPETSQLKFRANPKLDPENVLKQSKLHYTGTAFTFIT